MTTQEEQIAIDEKLEEFAQAFVKKLNLKLEENRDDAIQQLGAISGKIQELGVVCGKTAILAAENDEHKKKHNGKELPILRLTCEIDPGLIDKLAQYFGIPDSDTPDNGISHFKMNDEQREEFGKLVAFVGLPLPPELKDAIEKHEADQKKTAADAVDQKSPAAGEAANVALAANGVSRGPKVADGGAITQAVLDNALLQMPGNRAVDPKNIA